MNSKNMKEIRDLILQNAAFYDAPMNELKLKMLAQELAEFPSQEIDRAYAYYRKEKNRRQLPMPADLISYLQAAETDQDIAVTVVSRLIEAASKFGWNNLEKAKEHVGELGWLVVKRDGGWQSLCENLKPENYGYYKAQTRELLKTLSAQARAGTLNVAHGIPRSSESERLEKTDGPMLLGQFIKPPQEEGKK